MRHKGAEAALFAPHGPQKWVLFDELLKWDKMMTEEGSEVAAAVKAVGDQVEALLGVHCKQREQCVRFRGRSRPRTPEALKLLRGRWS